MESTGGCVKLETVTEIRRSSTIKSMQSINSTATTANPTATSSGSSRKRRRRSSSNRPRNSFVTCWN